MMVLERDGEPKNKKAHKAQRREHDERQDHDPSSLTNEQIALRTRSYLTITQIVVIHIAHIFPLMRTSLRPRFG